MSKKTLHNRLDNLFSDLNGIQPDQAEPVERQASGWVWECALDGTYLSCGPEVADLLGVQPGELVGKSLFNTQIDPKHTQVVEIAFQQEQYPQEVELNFTRANGQPVPARLTILSKTEQNGSAPHWRGFVQVLPESSSPQTTSDLPAASKPAPTTPRARGRVSGVAVEGDSVRATSSLWTRAGIQSLNQNQPVVLNSAGDAPSAIAVPVRLREHGTGILEVVDDSSGRQWSEDERLLVQEVANQLGLALENAELYQAVQQELSERTRAEQEIRQRNQDLSTLNLAGQQISRLTTAQEIMELVSSIIGQILGNDNLSIVLYSSDTREVIFPVHMEDGSRLEMPPRPLGNDLISYPYWTKKPLLITHNLETELIDRGITLPERLPLAVMAIPLMAGDRSVGAMVLQDFQRANFYTSIHVELLSTLASQVTTALENANLFQEIRAALAAIENRERYQSNVALVAAILSKYGYKALHDVLSSLGEAAQCSRVSFYEVVEAGSETYWQEVDQWVSPAQVGPATVWKQHRLTRQQIPHIHQQLTETGWIAKTVSSLPETDQQIFAESEVQSALLMAVPGRQSVPGILLFEQMDSEREWQLDEVRILQVAADALSNTILRENLLKQLQVSLRETENLYNMSHNLAVAGSLNEMISQIAEGLHDADINRYFLVTFTYDERGDVAKMVVSANWHSGTGTPPPPVGSELPALLYMPAFCQNSYAFIDDINVAQVDEAVRNAWQEQNIHSIALLPLWVSKKQIGVFVAASDVQHHFSDMVKRYSPPLLDQMATSVENIHLLRETENALEHTGLLYETTSQISQATNPQELAQVVARNLMPASASQVSLIQVNRSADGELTDLEIVGFHDRSGDTQLVGTRLPVSSLPWVKTAGSEVSMIGDMRSSDLDPVTCKTLLQMNAVAACLVPLRSAGSLVGLLLISSPTSSDYLAEELRILQVASSGLAVALEKQKLLREAERRALELRTAAELARDTSSTLSLDDLLNRIVNLLCERFSFYHASIFLLDATRTYAMVRESVGEAGRDMKARKHKLTVGSKSVIGTVTATGEPLIISDTSRSPIYYPNPLLPDTHSEMGIPLKLGTQVIGALDIQSTQINAFTKDDVAVLQILADQIAIAIDNARAYELSQKAVEEMREVDRMKSQFLANMSHELRTPLNSIIGFSRVILRGIDGPINETQNQDLTAIYNSGQHLLALINDILDLSKIEAGKMELSFSELQMSELVTSIMSTATGLIKGKPVKLLQVVPDDLPSVRADSTRVRQVLLNFVSNAAKFTEEGSITIEASVIHSPSGKREVMMTVTDTGGGIAPEDTHKLFQPFSQVDDSPTRKTGGTGLGLSICRSLIEMHGGRIGLLRSEIGVGSTFFFTLPLSDPEPALTAPGEGNVILAIDDDPQVIGLYERYLRPHGYQVVALTDPKQAVDKARELRPAAITLDIMMPEKDGWTVMRELKNDPDTRNIPIVVCSIMEEEEKGFSLGAADYLVKPFAQEDLINAINRLNNDGQIHEVLVIDDSPDDLRLVQKMLVDNSKFTVLLAEGGQAGWETIQARHPDAIILDLFMPDLNGFQILERLRSSLDTARIPVVVLTGADLTPEQQQQMAEFGQQLLAKGQLNEKELLRSLETSLQQLNLIVVKNT